MSEAYLDNCCGCGAIRPPWARLHVLKPWNSWGQLFGPSNNITTSWKDASQQQWVTITCSVSANTGTYGTGGTMTVDPVTGNVISMSGGGLSNDNSVWPTIASKDFATDGLTYSVTLNDAAHTVVTLSLSNQYGIGNLYADASALYNLFDINAVPDNTIRTGFYKVQNPMQVSTIGLDQNNFICLFPTVSQWNDMFSKLGSVVTEIDHTDLTFSAGSFAPMVLTSWLIEIPGGFVYDDLIGLTGCSISGGLQIRSAAGLHACQSDRFRSYLQSTMSLSGYGTQQDACQTINYFGTNINIFPPGLDSSVSDAPGAYPEQYGDDVCDRTVNLGYVQTDADPHLCPCVPG